MQDEQRNKSGTPTAGGASEPLAGFLIPPKVLVMDDEEIICEVVSDLLSGLGCAPSVAYKGEDAVELYGKAMEEGAPYAAVILDMNVTSGLNGLDTFMRLKELDPAVNAIIASGFMDEGTVKALTGRGVKGVITKPYTIKELYPMLEAFIKENGRPSAT